MIHFLHGELRDKAPAAVTVEVAGIGYQARIPLSTYEALPPVGQSVELLTHLHVREDELSLYGFASELERDLFRMLIGVNKIGPMVALRVLSSCTPGRFKRYVMEEDVDALKSMVKGIGAKMAQRLIVELKDTVEDLATAPEESPGGQAARDAVQALVALGETRPAAEKAVHAALEKLGADADRQRLIQQALSRS